MLGMAKNSIVLFFQGKLFANPGKVYLRLAIGVLITSALLIATAVAGAPFWAAAILAGFVGGAVQPYLFKDLRYR